MKVIKRDDTEQAFCLDKIVNAVTKANNSVEEADRMNEEQLQKVVATVQNWLRGFDTISVEDIQDLVEKSLVRHNKHLVAKNYILYRDGKKKDKKFTPSEQKYLAVLDGNSQLRGDNANKNIDDNGSIRDYGAGLMCKSIAQKMLPKDILEAHNKGIIHWHDMDYSPVAPMHNCDLINCEDMLTNGTQMGNTKIDPNDETPFRTICNLLSQFSLIVSGRQYGGQTITWSHALPYIEATRKQIMKRLLDEQRRFHNIILVKAEDALRNECESMIENIKDGETAFLYADRINVCACPEHPYVVTCTSDGIMELSNVPYDDFKTYVEDLVRDEIYEGVKIYQYQILCHMSSNGQTPFVSNNLCLREAQTQQELDDFAMLIEEIFKRRIKGVKDSTGHYITPLFPKLLYWTCDGLNVKESDPYFHLTELAAECEIKRTQPDINSEKECRRIKEGQIIPSMGCRSLLGPIWEEHTYPVDTEFYWTKVDGENRAYPYGTFVEKKDFTSIENGEYGIGYCEGVYAINFRGNTGWLMKKTDTEVTIWQPIVYGRFNQGVVTLNIPYVALEARQIAEETGADIIETFFDKFTERLNLVRKALKIRSGYVRNIKAINSELLWMRGALARMNADETVGDLMDRYPKRATISVGYVGLYETCRALINESNTTENGRELSKRIMSFMNDTCKAWKAEDHLNYAIYGTPEESLTYKFALANRKEFGFIEYVTDKDYVVNSYHVDPRENIDAFQKLLIEGEYLALSSGGAVSYVETLDLMKNPKAIVNIIQFMNEHILYAEFNRKIGVCYECGYEGDIDLIKTEDGNFVFRCPNCGNEDDSKMDVTARICGYLGKVNAGNTNKGRLDDIYNRVVHLDNYETTFIPGKENE